jgi:hypothetical protein
MKYYIYISDAKVDMLLPQVPHEIRKKVAVEFKTDIKIFSASRKTETESDDSRIARLETVLEFLREYGKVGTVEQPDDYIEDIVDMRWGPYASTGNDSIVYFGGDVGTTAIGLAGSMRHVIGNVGSGSPTVASLTPFIVKVLVDELGLQPPEIHPSLMNRSDVHTLPFEAVTLANENMSRGMTGPTQRLEFMAKRLLDSERDLQPDDRPSALQNSKRVLLGTPLYVAMVE